MAASRGLRVGFRAYGLRATWGLMLAFGASVVGVMCDPCVSQVNGQLLDGQLLEHIFMKN